MSYQIHDDEHVPLDAHYDLEEDTIVYHSRGGSKGSANALNTDYSIGLKLLLTRVSKSQVSITDAWVDSSRTQALPIEDRRIISVEDLSKVPDFIFRTMSARMKKVGRDPGALPTGGNATKRISIQ